MAAPAPIEVAKRSFEGENMKFQIGSMAKIAKRVAEENGYGFAEVMQRAKAGMAEFEFVLAHKFDYFARDEVKVEVSFENVKDGDGMQQGDVAVVIVGKVFLDYRNDWGKSPVQQFFFKVYQKYLAKARMGRLYMGPCAKLVEKVYEAYKEGLGIPS